MYIHVDLKIQTPEHFLCKQIHDTNHLVYEIRETLAKVSTEFSITITVNGSYIVFHSDSREEIMHLNAHLQSHIAALLLIKLFHQ